MYPWNKGLRLPEELCKKISEGRKGMRFEQEHKDRISETQKKRWQVVKTCSQCSKRSKWVYGVSIPSITFYILRLCVDCFLTQYFALNQEERKGVRIVE